MNSKVDEILDRLKRQEETKKEEKHSTILWIPGSHRLCSCSCRHCLRSISFFTLDYLEDFEDDFDDDFDDYSGRDDDDKGQDQRCSQSCKRHC